MYVGNVEEPVKTEVSISFDDIDEFTVTRFSDYGIIGFKYGRINGNDSSVSIEEDDKG
jgi:hypothetical protein